MYHKKSQLLKTLAILLSLSSLFIMSAAAIAADAYPSRTIRLIIPTTPGGSSDQIGRLIAAKLTERLDKAVVLDFRSGGGGIIGTEAAAKSDPDGYTLIFIASSYTMQPALEKLPYDPIKSLIPIVKVATTPHSLVVHPSVPANSVNELIAMAKQKPGQIIFGTAGLGSAAHMGAELFRIAAGIDYKIVHFKGGGAQIIDLLGGHHQADFGAVFQNMPHIESGKFRILATTGAKRSVILPNVPTITESGISGCEYSQWFGILAPAGTPAPIVGRLSKEIGAIVTSEEVKKALLAQGAEVDVLGPAEFGPFIEKEIAKWIKVVKQANIKVN